MLKSLHIENYALIRETDIDFASGFVTITGETGAGKSIMLGALGLLLGQRADTQVLSDKDRKCVVEAVFDVTGLGLQPLFEEQDVDYDDNLILRREILPSSKSRAFVNDSPAGLQFLKELAPHLIDIHSQHQTLTLTESTFQTRLLDTLAVDSPLEQYQKAYRQYAELKRKLESLMESDAQSRKDHDYNQFLFQELSSAKLRAGEQEELEEESRLLEHTESIKQALGAVMALCDSDAEDCVMTRLFTSRAQLAHVVSCHTAVEQLHARIDSCIIELRDVLAEVSDLDERLQFSPERQQQVEERLDLIYSLQKKHGVSDIASLLAIQQRLDEQLQLSSGLDEQIRQTMERVDEAFARLGSQAELLTASRRRSAQLLEEQVLPVLAQLGMAESQLQVEIAPATDFGPMGHDSVRLLFNANRGGALRPLAEVASGGELSRLMLAVKSLVTRQSLLPTIIFDEIDTGVSGDISVAVGRIMCRMADSMQVIAITHLPQIAAKAAQHLKVAKAVETDADMGRTISRIRQLQADERVTEIAVMLSSNPPTQAALQTAKELMISVVG